MELGKEYFGPFWKFIAKEENTDVDYSAFKYLIKLKLAMGKKKG